GEESAAPNGEDGGRKEPGPVVRRENPAKNPKAASEIKPNTVAVKPAPVAPAKRPPTPATEPEKIPPPPPVTVTALVPVAKPKTRPIELVKVAAGKFWRGSPDTDPDAQPGEKPRREVTITQPFFLGKTKITQAQYQEVMGKNPSAFAPTGRYRALVAGKDTGR